MFIFNAERSFFFLCISREFRESNTELLNARKQKTNISVKNTQHTGDLSISNSTEKFSEIHLITEKSGIWEGKEKY